jgi:RND family efflux transporter MFP subunit
LAVAPAGAATTPATREATKTPPTYQTSGPLVVENQVDVLAQRDGVVDRIAADVGTRARKGQVLAELDNRQLKADRDAAASKVASVRFEFQHWEAEEKVRQADLDRDEEMWKAQLITAKQMQHSRYSVEGAKYETQREGENLRTSENTLHSLELELEKTRIVAPFDGVVARRYVRVGQRVRVNDRLFWVSAMAPLNVKFTIPQEFVGKVKTGDAVSVSATGATEKHMARISMLSPVVDPSSGTIEVQARVEGAPSDLLPGMTVEITLRRPQ